MRRKILSAALIPAMLLGASCTSAATGDSPVIAVPSGGAPVELEAGSPFTARAYLNLTEGWAVAVEPGTGNLLITEKGGTAKYFNPATGETWPVSGLPPVSYGGQGGLGDVAFAPDYATSGMVYLTWAQAAGAQPAGGEPMRRAAAARGRLQCAAGSCEIIGLTEIWHQQPLIASAGHFSHKLLFSPDGRYLYLTSGERMQGDPAQSLSTNLGKVLRLNLDGTPAAGNPFAAQGGVAAQIWSYGHRNLLGIDFAPDGRLWELEHGPRGGDELNLITPGANYGWPVRSNGNDYDGDDIPDHTADDGFTKPAIFWDPVIAPGDMLIYRGAMFPQFRGQVLIAAMSSVNAIVQVRIDGAAGTATEVARHRFPLRLRSLAEAADGSLWVVEDGPRGRLLHLTPAG